jgi:hypothetical protein
MYTWHGDIDLNGQIDADDYFRIDAGFLNQAKGRRNGDINNDGKIDADDYFMIDSSFLGQSARPVPRAASVYTLTHADAVAVPLPSAAWQGAALVLAIVLVAAYRRTLHRLRGARVAA